MGIVNSRQFSIVRWQMKFYSDLGDSCCSNWDHIGASVCLAAAGAAAVTAALVTRTRQSRVWGIVTTASQIDLVIL